MKHLLISLVSILAASKISAATIVVPASMDNTLYEDAAGALSNGKGQFLFAGRTGINNDFKLRRAVLGFDLTAAIPAGATIDSVTLRLSINAASPAEPQVTLSLHRVLASWGEGTSNAGAPGGDGASATTGDATWIHRSFNTSLWAKAGGDFTMTESAGADVSGVGTVNFSSPGLVTDVRSWVDNPGSNFGWIIIGDEENENSSKRFASRENSSVANRPVLIVEYTSIPEPALVGTFAFGSALLGFRRPHRR